MNTLIIKKKSLKTWLHTDSILGDFIISKFYFNSTNLTFQIVEQGQSRRIIYNISDITLYNTIDGGGAETFATISELSLRLEQLNYPAFQYDGQITSIANLIEEGTNITITGDGTLLSPYVISATGSAGGTPTLQEVTTAGAITNVNTIWESPTDPTNIYIEINTTDNLILFWDKNIDAVNAIGVYGGIGNIITTPNGSVSFGENTGGIFQQYVMSNGQNMLFGFRELPIFDVTKQPTYLLNPDKLTAEYVLATLDDIAPTPTLQEVTDEGNTTTNTLEHNNGSNLKATLSNDGTIALLSFYNSTYFASTPQGVYAGHGFELGDEYGQGAGISAYVQYDNGFIGIKFSRALATANIMLQLNYGDFAGDDITLFLPKGTALISNAVIPISVNGNLADEYGDITISAGDTTDLGYTPSPTNGIVTSSTGTDATLPLADATDAGLLQPADFTQLSTLATDLANINTDAVDKVTVKLALGITKGQAVYISSATGTNIIVSKASNTSEATSSKTLGLLATTGVTNDIVEVVTSGLLDGLDTSTATIGDPVWLGTSGNLIYGLASKPVAPAHLVYIGVVSRVHATVGEIFVRVQNGFELKEIHDVLITSVADNDILAYESSTSLWENKTASALGLATQTALDLRTRELLQDFTAYTTTGVLTEQIISNQAITANDMKINSWLNFIATLDRTGTLNATVAIYLNTTSNSLSGAVKIGTAAITSAQSLPCFKRDFSINASSVLRGLLATVGSATDEITASSTSSQSTTTLTLGSAYYLITTVALNGITDTVTQRAINLKSSR